jgi:hypothetical protein
VETYIVIKNWDNSCDEIYLIGDDDYDNYDYSNDSVHRGNNNYHSNENNNDNDNNYADDNNNNNHDNINYNDHHTAYNSNDNIHNYDHDNNNNNNNSSHAYDDKHDNKNKKENNDCKIYDNHNIYNSSIKDKINDIFNDICDENHNDDNGDNTNLEDINTENMNSTLKVLIYRYNIYHKKDKNNAENIDILNDNDKYAKNTDTSISGNTDIRIHKMAYFRLCEKLSVSLFQGENVEIGIMCMYMCVCVFMYICP